MENLEIRTMLLENNIKHFVLAKESGIADTTLCRRLRYEVTPKQKQEIIEAIERIKARD